MTIRRTLALALLLCLLVAAPWMGMFVQRPLSWVSHDWIHAFCLTQAVLLASCAVYGPTSFGLRMPFVIAWGMAIGFVLATVNVISGPGRASPAAGIILVLAGTLSPLIVFTLHRWRSGAQLIFGGWSRMSVPRAGHQISLRTLMILTAAFSVAGVAARSALTAPPSGDTNDSLVLQAWLAFFPCLAAAPALLVIFRPSWKILLGCSFFFVFVTLADPLLFGLSAPFIFQDKTLPGAVTTWSYLQDAWIDTMFFNGQAASAVVVYAALARTAGFQMIVPDQSNDKKPNPSGEPAAEAGCVQD